MWQKGVDKIIYKSYNGLKSRKTSQNAGKGETAHDSYHVVKEHEVQTVDAELATQIRSYL